MTKYFDKKPRWPKLWIERPKKVVCLETVLLLRHNVSALEH